MTLPTELLPGGPDRRASPPFWEGGRPTPPRSPKPCTKRYDGHVTSVWGGAWEPQSGFPDGVGVGGGGGRRRAVLGQGCRRAVAFLGSLAVGAVQVSDKVIDVSVVREQQITEDFFKVIAGLDEQILVQCHRSRRKS